MMIDIPTFIAIVVPSTGVLVWLVRLEGRVNLHDRLLEDMGENVREIKHDVKSLLQTRHSDDLQKGL